MKFLLLIFTNGGNNMSYYFNKVVDIPFDEAIKHFLNEKENMKIPLF